MPLDPLRRAVWAIPDKVLDEALDHNMRIYLLSLVDVATCKNKVVLNTFVCGIGGELFFSSDGAIVLSPAALDAASIRLTCAVATAILRSM